MGMGMGMVGMASMTSNNRHACLLLILLPVTAFAVDWKFSPKISLSERYSDNITLSAVNPESSFMTEVTPGFNLSHKGGRVSLSVDYGLQALLYSYDGDSNSFGNQLFANFKSELIEDRFYLDADARITQQNTKLTGATGSGSYNVTGNRSETRSVSITPAWRTKITNSAQFDARWQLSYSNSDSGAISGTVDSVLGLNLTSGSVFNSVPWSLSYRLQNNDGVASANRYSSLSGSLGYVLSPKTRLNLTVGNDSNNGSTVGFNRASGINWGLGLNWNPSARTGFGVTVGHRYSGNSYGLDFTHRTRKSTWSIRYSENIVDTFGQINGEDTYLCNGFQVRVPAGTTPDFAVCPVPILINRHSDSTQLVNDTTLNKAWSGAASYNAGKSTLSLSLNKSRRELLTAGTSDESNNFGGSWSLRLNPRLISALSVSSNHAKTVLSKSDDWMFVWSLTRRLSEKTTGALEASRVERGAGSTSGAYKENSVSAHVNMSF